jgi:hypothetical protein
MSESIAFCSSCWCVLERVRISGGRSKKNLENMYPEDTPRYFAIDSLFRLYGMASVSMRTASGKDQRDITGMTRER